MAHIHMLAGVVMGVGVQETVFGGHLSKLHNGSKHLGRD